MTDPGGNANLSLQEITRQAALNFRAKRDALANVELTNGIVLEMTGLPEEPVRRAVEAIPLPDVPNVKIDDITEPNPEDPEYKEALEQALYQRTQAGFRVATILGTKCKEAPAGQRPEDDQWIDDLKLVGVDVDTSSERARYIDWLYMSALSNTMDRTVVAQAALQFSFVEVRELSEAIQWFWDRGRRDAAAASEVEEGADIDGGDLPGATARVGVKDAGAADGGEGEHPVADLGEAAADDEGGTPSVGDGQPTDRPARRRARRGRAKKKG